MNGGPQELEVFNVALRVEPMGADGFRARALYRGPGVAAGLTLWPSAEELEDLLRQIERQYHEFHHPVAWASEAAGKRLELAWSMTRLGHVEAGRARLEDRVTDWRLDGQLRGDQSYLPRIAMGLQLLTRR